MRITTAEFTKSGSLHGMQYIFESGKGLVGSRVGWTAIVLMASIIGIVWSAQVIFGYCTECRIRDITRDYAYIALLEVGPRFVKFSLLFLFRLTRIGKRIRF